MTQIDKKDLILDIRLQKTQINKWKTERIMVKKKLANIDKRIAHHADVISMLADDLVKTMEE